MKRRMVVKSLSMTGLVQALPTFAQSGGAGTYPDRPVKIVVQFPPGTTPDILARLAADHLQAQLKQPFIVENRPGASGNIAADVVSKSPADGYTLLLGQVGLTWAKTLFGTLSFDPAALKPVSVIADVPFVLGARPDLPAKNVPELVALLRSRPGELTCATSGSGAPQHLMAELFMAQTGTRLNIVPYKGSTQVMPDLLAGRVDLLFNAAESFLPFVQGNKLKVLAAASKARLPQLPDVPTLKESGVEIDASLWVGLFAPPNTPDAIALRIAHELGTMRNNTMATQKIASAGNLLVLSTPEDMKRTFAADSKLWSGVIKSAGIKLDQ